MYCEGFKIFFSQQEIFLAIVRTILMILNLWKRFWDNVDMNVSLIHITSLSVLSTGPAADSGSRISLAAPLRGGGGDPPVYWQAGGGDLHI
jgi:hypothetical protein